MSDVRKRCNELYEIIESSKEELEQIRKKCNHQHISFKPYQFRVGQVIEGTVCDDCGHIITEGRQLS